MSRLYFHLRSDIVVRDKIVRDILVYSGIAEKGRLVSLAVYIFDYIIQSTRKIP